MKRGKGLKARKGLQSKSKRKGSSFERRANQVYQEKSGESSRLQVNSGAFKNLPGDLWSPTFLQEAKESGIVDAKGKKQITIKKEWLDKARDEAEWNRKPFCLPFNFSDDPDIYCVVSYDQLAEMVYQINTLTDLVSSLPEPEREPGSRQDGNA